MVRAPIEGHTANVFKFPLKVRKWGSSGIYKALVNDTNYKQYSSVSHWTSDGLVVQWPVDKNCKPLVDCDKTLFIWSISFQNRFAALLFVKDIFPAVLLFSLFLLCLIWYTSLIAALLLSLPTPTHLRFLTLMNHQFQISPGLWDSHLLPLQQLLRHRRARPS